MYNIDLQKATVSTQAFYSEDVEGEEKRSKAPWILKRLVSVFLLLHVHFE